MSCQSDPAWLVAEHGVPSSLRYSIPVPWVLATTTSFDGPDEWVQLRTWRYPFTSLWLSRRFPSLVLKPHYDCKPYRHCTQWAFPRTLLLHMTQQVSLCSGGHSIHD